MLSSFRLRLLAASAVVAVAAAAPMKSAEASIMLPMERDIVDLAFLLDESGSIGADNFENIILPGLANAIQDIVPQADAMEGDDLFDEDFIFRVTVGSFSNDADLVVAPTIVDSMSIAGIVSSILGTEYDAGRTNLAEGIALIEDELDDFEGTDEEARFGTLNVSTDGRPNEPGGTFPAGEAAALDARDDLFANTSISSVSAEAIGTSSLNFLEDLTGATCCAPPFPGNIFAEGFILQIEDLEDYEETIAQKVEIVVNGDMPEPATLALVGAGLAGIGLAVRRRRRAAA